MDIYSEELQKIISFAKDNQELVESALGLVAISIMKTLNEFNVFESKLTVLIANYYRASYSPELDFKKDVLDQGYISYGQKLKILKKILEKSNFYLGNSVDSKKFLNPLKTLGELRNNIIHSIYGLDPERVDSDQPKMIIYANGRRIDKKDLMTTFSDFEKYYNKSGAQLNNVANFLVEMEKENE